MTKLAIISTTGGLLKNIVDVTRESIDSDTMFQILLVVIIIDILTGIGRSYKEKTWNSTVGLNGMIRHGIILIVSGVVYYFSRQMNAEQFAHAFTFAFTVEYLISISENWALSGYKLPNKIEDLLEKIKETDYEIITKTNDETKKDITMEHDKNDEDRLQKMANKVLGVDKDE